MRKSIAMILCLMMWGAALSPAWSGDSNGDQSLWQPQQFLENKRSSVPFLLLFLALSAKRNPCLRIQTISVPEVSREKESREKKDDHTPPRIAVLR